MPMPTHEEGVLLLRLLELWPHEAYDWLHTEEYMPDHKEFTDRYPDGSKERRYLGTVVDWFETIGTLHKYGLINEDLLFDWQAIDVVWDMVKDHVFAVREEHGADRYYENFEAMAKAEKEWVAARECTAA